MGGKGVCCCTPDTCVDACPVHAAVASYTAVIGDFTATLVSPEADCNFIGSDCVVTSPSQTNAWTIDYGDFTFQDYFDCWWECDFRVCCNGSQEPGQERDPAVVEGVQTAYEQISKYIRWEQERESVTVQLYDVGSGNLRILVTVMKEILYMVGANTNVRGGYRVATITYCTPAYPDYAPVLPEIPCTITYGDPIWDAWPAHPDPGYPPCNAAESNPVGCEFTVGATPTVYFDLETEAIGPFDNAYCDDYTGLCVTGTYNTIKAVSRVYDLQCFGGNTEWGFLIEYCGGVYNRPNHRTFGYYYYYSDPFPCDAFPANPIPLKRDPYTDIAASTEYETVCGQSFPYSTPAVPKDLEITIT